MREQLSSQAARRVEPLETSLETANTSLRKVELAYVLDQYSPDREIDSVMIQSVKLRIQVLGRLDIFLFSNI